MNLRCARWIAGAGVVGLLYGCAAPNRVVTIDEQFCWRHFGKDCPTATYTPPPAPQPPPGRPAPDLKLSKITCDDVFGRVFVSAQVSNEGDADALVAADGNSLTVTVKAELRTTPPTYEITQNSLPGAFPAHIPPLTIRVGVGHSWSDIASVRVSVDTERVWQERNYANNALDAVVSPTALPESKTFDQVFCDKTG